MRMTNVPPAAVLSFGMAVLSLLGTSFPTHAEPPTPAAAPERIDRFGELLPPGAIARMGSFRIRNRCDWVTLSPDSKLIAADGTLGVRLWQVDGGKPVSQFRDHPDSLHNIAFSPDGKTVASWGKTATIRLWDLATGKQLAELGGQQTLERLLGFSHDGAALVSESHDPVDKNRTVRVYDVTNGKQILQVGGLEDERFVRLSGDGRMLASLFSTGKNDWLLRLWDLRTGKQLARYPAEV